MGGKPLAMEYGEGWFDLMGSVEKKRRNKEINFQNSEKTQCIAILAKDRPWYQFLVHKFC